MWNKWIQVKGLTGKISTVWNKEKGLLTWKFCARFESLNLRKFKSTLYLLKKSRKDKIIKQIEELSEKHIKKFQWSKRTLGEFYLITIIEKA